MAAGSALVEGRLAGNNAGHLFFWFIRLSCGSIHPLSQIQHCRSSPLPHGGRGVGGEGCRPGVAPPPRGGGGGGGEGPGLRKSEAHHAERAPALSPGPSPISWERGANQRFASGPLAPACSTHMKVRRTIFCYFAVK